MTTSKQKALRKILWWGLLSFCLVLALYAPVIVKSLTNGALLTNLGVYAGRFTQGVSIRHDFRLWNTSFRTQNISLVTPSCHCSIAKVDRYSIPPFSHATISLIIDTHGFPSGAVAKGAIIDMADGQRISDACVTFTIVPSKKKPDRS
jgi:hypothetical protein